MNAHTHTPTYGDGGQDYKSDKWMHMWYTIHSCTGIRRKFGDKKQIFSFGGRTCGLSKEQQHGFGCMVLKKLDAGMKEKDVEAWVRKAVQRDS